MAAGDGGYKKTELLKEFDLEKSEIKVAAMYLLSCWKNPKCLQIGCPLLEGRFFGEDNKKENS